MNCFLIDDDPDDQDFFSLALDELAIHVSLKTANNGIEALDMLTAKSFRPDVIFIDINMPRMDGWQCLAEIRKIETLRPVPVIIFSTSEDSNNRPMSEDFNGYVTKQPNVDALAKALAETFSNLQIMSKSRQTS